MLSAGLPVGLEGQGQGPESGSAVRSLQPCGDAQEERPRCRPELAGVAVPEMGGPWSGACGHGPVFCGAQG